MSNHALLSASGASRWVNCPPSAILEENHRSLVGETTSEHAELGTAAHEYARLVLLNPFGMDKGFTKQLKKHERDVAKRFGKESVPEMERNVRKYVDYIKQVISESDNTVLTLVEQKVYFEHIVPDGFGTPDYTLVSGNTLHVVDLKYGEGVQVFAKDNLQLTLYSLGALKQFEGIYDITDIHMHIAQPRLDHFDKAKVTVQELLDVAENTIRPAAELAVKGEGEQKTGSHCKFCKVKGACVKQEEEHRALAQLTFTKPELLPDETILDLLPKLAAFQEWVSAVEAFALENCLAGKEYPGWKVVEGRANRKWVDEQQVINVLSNKYPEDVYLVKKVIGVPAAEKLLGNKFNELLGGIVTRPTGKPTLVESSDKRESILGRSNTDQIFECLE